MHGMLGFSMYLHIRDAQFVQSDKTIVICKTVSDIRQSLSACLGVWEHLELREDVLERWDRERAGQTPVELLGPAGVFSNSPIGLSIPPDTSEKAMLTTCSLPELRPA